MPEPLRWDMILPNGEPLRWNMGSEFVWNGNVPEHLYPNTPMQQNDLSITITQPQEDAIHAKAAELRALIVVWAISLNDNQRARYFKLGAGRLEFDQKCDAYLHQRPDLVPPNSNVAEYDKDGDALIRIKRMKASVATIDTLLDDSGIVAGSDRMDLNMKLYHYTEFGGLIGLAGADAVHDDLKSSYPGRGPSQPPTPPTPPP